MAASDTIDYAPELLSKIDEWLEWDRVSTTTLQISYFIEKCHNGIFVLELYWDCLQNEKTRTEVQQLVATKEYSTLSRLLLKRLSFGTAGLRGEMRAGFAAINDLVVIQTAQGLAKYIQKSFPNELSRGIVFGYDGRHNSKR